MNKIINILKKKPIPLDKFINIALYDKKTGYYMKKNPFGEKGDFVTSPLISKLFSEIIAVWCVAYWKYLGKPKKILIVELGPGDGSLCEDLLHIFKKFRNFYSCLEIKLFEISDKLRKIQKIKINNKKVKWLNKLEKINAGPVIFFGNEFFDSLPIKQFYKKNNTFLEKYIALSDNKIKFYYEKLNKNSLKELSDLNLSYSKKTIEYPIKSIEYLKIISKKIQKFDGGLLTFDYGYTKNDNKNTLQSVKKHKYNKLFSNIGDSDITSHVNFKLFCQILKKENLNVKKIVNQNEFLQKSGIIERANMAAKKMTFKEKADMYYRLKKLLDQNEMGNLFKVLFAQKKDRNFSLGF
tara:strand:+ start:3441 stop:4496 length:1056 start_codon:yes stop_codon:yes gene_type:complete